ncbi:AAA domain-containing protein [Bacteroides sp. 519]|uniref:ATP-dependent helicase n=1 Tax=Bacteroides sp. 519 TaxID=2302937 RepID=UPI0013D36FD1|nr:AAA domain-containing protein [Bacteroides sp. 519]NDV59133.1 DNA helicase [Bacteroides sp. 519]
MKNEAADYFDMLLYLCQAEDISLSTRYKQLRDLLERICKDQMENESLQITDLSARLNFVAIKLGLSNVEQNRLHTFRLTSNAILNRQAEPEVEKLMRDIKTISFFVRKIYEENIPVTLYKLLPRADATYLVASPGVKHIDRMRVSFQYADESYLYVTPLDAISDDYLRVRYNISQINDEFAETCEMLWRFARLNLLDVTEDENGILTPSFIVLEPDYLLDISSLAECYKDYGNHPANYQLNKLQLPENTQPLLLGNIANLFLDEWIYANGEVDYGQCMQKVFRRHSLELASCTDLYDPEKEKEFFNSCKMHFEHIRETVQNTFRMVGYNLDKSDAVLEPSYVCEALGLQGRLDYMQRDASSIIEMKSGKGDEYAIQGKVVPKENHKVQMLLYQAILQYTLGKKHQEVNAYLFYTRYPMLYPARSSWAMVRRAINLRNKIVADEYSIQFRNNIYYTQNRLKEIDAGVLNQRGLKGHFWETYLRPSIDRIYQKIEKLSPIEKVYFLTLYNFIIKEQYTAKTGSTDYNGRTGAASLWLSTFMEKCESGEILYDLTIQENHATDEHKAHVIFSRNVPDTQFDNDFPGALPNFREGDAVVLYERNTSNDNATNRMVFKGNIEYLTDKEIAIRLRATQHNTSVLPADSLYAVEHDSMDTTFRNMFAGLATFISANRSRRELLLGLRQPEFNTTLDDKIMHAEDDFQRIALKAFAARDYFLLIGPPGTGKTSQALRRMVETFHENPDTQILLLAYTNRAVDEICKSLTSIRPQVNFIRVGSELSCDVSYRPYLLENILVGCKRRNDVRNKISQCRIFVGTVATLSNKPELFKLKTFDIAIIDEATQILEPQLLGILSASDNSGKNAIGKFILIGDHKQLPAVVLQSPEQTEIYEENLRAIGITNLKDSLFERLYRSLKLMNNEEVFTRSVDMLSKQGRMHPAVAHFANNAFYNGKLQALGLPHQQDTTEPEPDIENAIRITSRMFFIPSEQEKHQCSGKTNYCEARLAAKLVALIYEKTVAFNPHQTIGVITPYRSQIALIKKEISRFGIDCLNNIMVDTVERFQGSERDVIIYSFCINYSHQLRLLSNVIEDDGCLIDRKLNVALTRARKQMYILGVRELLNQNSIYSNLIKLQE